MNIIKARTALPKKEEIKEWEIKNKFKFSADYKSFLSKFNGGIPEKRVYKEIGVHNFVLDFFYELTVANESYSLNYAIEMFNDIFELNFLPIAREISGGLVLLDTNGRLFFWNHESEVLNESFIEITKPLHEFMNCLVEEKEIVYGNKIDLIDDGSKEDIIKFLNSGYNINEPLEIGRTIVERASLLKKNWLLEELIKRGANLKGGLEQCITKDNLGGFKLLLENGADANEITSSDYSLLMDLVISEKVLFISELMKYNPNTEWTDEYGETALEVAMIKLESGDKIMEDIIKLIK